MKKIFKKLDTPILILLIIGIIGAVNFLASNLFFRLDLTENKDYSLSSFSKSAAKELDDIVNIKAYFSDDLPGRYLTLKQEVADILDEYNSSSRGKVRVKFTSPADDEKTKIEMYSLRIPQIQFNVLEKDKYEVRHGYLGMVIEYGDKREVIPVVETTQNLEYKITLAIKKLTSDEMPALGYIASRENEAEIQEALEKLREIYTVQKIDLTKDKILDDIATLIIIDKGDWTEDELRKIDEFFIKGKSLLVLSDGVNVAEGLAPIPNISPLHELIENYGIKINKDLVLDVSSGFTTFSSGFISFALNYPFWPKLIKSGFDANNAAVASLESVILPWASSLELINPGQHTQNNDVISYLANTTKRSWREAGEIDLNPQKDFYPLEPPQAHSLALSIAGKFQSMYTGNITENARLIVAGDSDFIKEGYLNQSKDNITFFQNLVDTLSIDEDLINIRSKGVTERPIIETSDSSRNAIRYINIFGATILALGFGLFRHYARRRKREF